MPTKVLHDKIPLELLLGKTPSFEHLKVFGCLCYMSTHKHGRDKLQARAVPCVFLGYPFGQKAYKVMDIQSRKIYSSRDVVFHEQIFPFSPSFQKAMAIPAEQAVHFDEESVLPPIHPITESPITDQQHPTSIPSSSEDDTSVRRSSRLHKTPTYLDDYVHSALTEPLCFSTLTNLTLQPPTFSSLCLHSSSQQVLDRLSYTEPQSYTEAILHPAWQVAMDQELQALQDTKTWDIVFFPQGKKPIACRWVYRVK